MAVCEGMCHQAWQPEFDFWNPYSGKRESIIKDCPLNSENLPRKHTYTNTHKLLINYSAVNIFEGLTRFFSSLEH